MTSTSSNPVRYLGAVSIGFAILGSIVSLILLTGPSHGTMPGIGGCQKIFALLCLSFTNVVTLISNTIYFFYTQKPKWLKIIILMQLMVALITLALLI